MKKFAFILIIIIGPFLSIAQEVDRSNLVKTGDIAPQFEFNIAKGQKANLKNYKGKIVMLSFFGAWCSPCLEELPHIKSEIWDKYKNNPNFILLAFGWREGWDVVLPFKEKHHYPFLMLPDEDAKIFGLFANHVIPRIILIDETGKVIYQSTGFEKEEFNKLLKVLSDKLPGNS